MESAGYLAVSCVIGLVWFDELWVIGEVSGRWLGRKILYFFGGDQ